MLLTPWPWLFSMPGGGGTPIEADLLDTLVSAGFAIDVIAPRADRASGFEGRPGVTLSTVNRTRLPAHGRVLRALGWLETTGRFLLAALAVSGRHGRPRVVYGVSAFTSPAAFLAGVLLRRPSIGVLLGTFLYPLIGSRRKTWTAFEEVVAFRLPFDRLVLLDDGTRADRVAAHFNVPSRRVRFWMSGIDPDACARAVASPSVREELGIPLDVPLVLSASRLASWKRVDRILRAMTGVLEEHPLAVLVVSGTGPAEAELRNLAHELGLEGSVKFTGALDREQNLRLIAQCDVFCSFYDYSNIGVALLEALSCGVPVVAADTGATRELIGRSAGIVVPPDDCEAAVAAIGSVLSDPGLATSLRRGALDVVGDRLITVSERRALELEMLAELLRDPTILPRDDLHAGPH